MADEIPEGWKECRLGDIAELVKEKYTPRKGDELNYIGLEHIQEQALRLKGIGRSDDIKSDKFYFKKGDILFGKLRPYFRKVVRPDFDGVCSTDIWVIRSKGSVIQDYLFYLFANKELVDLSNSGESGTRMPRADWKFMSQTIWSVPKCESEQRAIASVLSSLDDKIDLLQRENKTLEAMAETLFRQWFMEEASDDWDEVPLSDVCVILNGFAFKSKDYREEGIRIIRTLNFMNGFIDLNDLVYIDYDCEEDYKKYRLRDNDFLMVMVGANLGNFAIVTSDILPALQNQNMWNFRATNKVSQYYLNYALIKIIKDNIGSASGSAREFFQKKQFYSFNIKIPPLTILEKFDYLMNNFFQKMKNNRLQIHTLKKLRDILLPKLMSGEVRVTLTEEKA